MRQLPAHVPYLEAWYARYHGFLRRYKRFARAMELASGALLVLIGVLILTNRLAAVVAWFPFLNRFAR